MSIFFRIFFPYFTFLLLSITSLSSLEYNLAVCTIFKDCAPYLKEWIEYHRLVGVEHFYLFDNSSTDDPNSILEEYVKQGIVTLTDWPNRNEDEWGTALFAWVSTTQKPCYEYAYELAKNKTKWLAFIDSDEFLVSMKSLSMTKLLSKYENVPAVMLQWVVYGTSNIYEIPSQRLMIEMLTLRTKFENPINKHKKIIVQPDGFFQWKSCPHRAECCNGALPYEIPLHEARINHYFNRDVKFFYEHKVKNKSAMDNVKNGIEFIQYHLELGNDVEDLTMKRFIPKLRKRMGFPD